MNTTPTPDWQSMPDLLSSIEVARLFHVLPKTLSKYAQRGTIKPPVERGANHAMYRKEDVKEFWELRELRKAQGYIKAPDEPPTGDVHPADTPPTEIATRLPPDALEAMTEAVAEGVRRGQGDAVAELVAEVRALREELAALRGAAMPDAEKNTEPPTIPPTKTFLQRLFNK